MKKVFLKKQTTTAKFNVTFPSGIPLEYQENRVKHPNRNLWLSVKDKDITPFLTHNDKDILGGGHLQGEVIETYANLKKLFGLPTKSDGYKSDAEWEIEFVDGTIAFIYNWKDGKNYNGKSGLGKSNITNWHIGGDSNVVVDLVKLALSGKLINREF